MSETISALHERISTGERLLRGNEVQRITSLSRTTIWRLERAGQFPKRRQLSANAVGWLQSEVFGWVASKAA